MKRGKYSEPDHAWCEICDGHHGPGQHPESPVAPPPASPEPMPEPVMPSGWEVIESPGVGVAFRRAGSGYRYITLDVIEALLATQGLHIVDEASTKTRIARAVALLDAAFGAGGSPAMVFEARAILKGEAP